MYTHHLILKGFTEFRSHSVTIKMVNFHKKKSKTNINNLLSVMKLTQLWNYATYEIHNTEQTWLTNIIFDKFY